MEKDERHYAELMYIPYHNAEIGNNDKRTVIKNFGLPVTARRYRDKLIGNMSEQDIRKRATPVENPMIGTIPDRTQIRHDLDILVATM